MLWNTSDLTRKTWTVKVKKPDLIFIFLQSDEEFFYKKICMTNNQLGVA